MRIPIRIYYEDTDCAGMVYYANYLKYFERGRTEYLRELGVSLSGYHDRGIVFVVRRAEVDYLAPCRYDDLITLDTEVAGTTRATITFEHTVRKDGAGGGSELVRGTVVVASVGGNGKPVGLPEGLKAALEGRGTD